jgi:tetratricopeptide (TPR) repeat protein
MTIDVRAMWDFDDPEGSEARFRAALDHAAADDALVLWTQIARTWSLRRQPERAREILDELRRPLEGAGPEPRIRWELELGRTWVSAVSTPEDRTPAAVELASDAYTRAFELARDAGLDELAVDAVHMMVFVDTDPADQLAWNDRGLALARASSQPGGRRWEAALLNNRGMALHELGRDEEALADFRAALALRQAEDDAGSIRVAWWMIAWSLRQLGRPSEALPIQLRLEEECAAAGDPDPYVFEELALLYRALGDPGRAAAYERLKTAG